MTVDVQVCLLCQKDRKKLGKQDGSWNSAVRGGSSPAILYYIQIHTSPRILTTFDQVQGTLCAPVTHLKKYSTTPLLKKKKRAKVILAFYPTLSNFLRLLTGLCELDKNKDTSAFISIKMIKDNSEVNNYFRVSWEENVLGFFFQPFFKTCAQPLVPEECDGYLCEGDCSWQSESRSRLCLDRRFAHHIKLKVRKSLTHPWTQAATVKTAHLPQPQKGRKQDGMMTKRKKQTHFRQLCFHVWTYTNA